MPDGFRASDVADNDAIALDARGKWLDQARPKQIPPTGRDWSTLIWLAGRFFGKTVSLSQASWWEGWRRPGIRIHALAPTASDLRRVVFEGESGLVAKCPPELVKSYVKSPWPELTLVNGTMIYGFSVTEEADRLRGPQCHFLTFDEAAAADKPAGNLETAYKAAALGCRLQSADGIPARKLIATTPRPIQFLRNLTRRPGVVVVHGTSYENLANVSVSVREELLAIEGTTYARQELMGEFLDLSENAIFQRKWFRLWPAHRKMPEFLFLLMTIDTAYGEEAYDAKKDRRDYTACAVWGIFHPKGAFTDTELKKLGVRSPKAALLCDFWMNRAPFPEMLEQVRESYRLKYGSPGRRCDVVLIEDKTSGAPLRQSLGQYGVPAWPYNPGHMSKTMRAHAVAPLLLQGMLFVPESAKDDRQGEFRDWAEPLVEQCCAFAGKGSVEHDDAVDAMSSAMIYFQTNGMLSLTPLRAAMPDPDEAQEQKEREAIRVRDRERAGAVSPYGE